jgi:hypothetical protein
MGQPMEGQRQGLTASLSRAPEGASLFRMPRSPAPVPRLGTMVIAPRMQQPQATSVLR